MEEWKPVPGFEGLYDVSSEGRIRSYRISGRTLRTHSIRLRTRAKVLKHYKGKSKYAMAALSRKDGSVWYRRLHQLVALAFIGQCPQGHQVEHLDGNGHNNRLNNIAYASPKVNNLRKSVHGTQPAGENHCCSKLTQAQVDAIRKMYSNGILQKTLADKFKVSRSHISGIVNGRFWKYTHSIYCG